jgi:hypothetical protein
MTLQSLSALAPVGAEEIGSDLFDAIDGWELTSASRPGR